ncbi:MAG TPA: energy transducer TonB [Candidatus Polarisedimenticolia bacterium]|nr:energy transducer TonB [Candidatus Polarisedimenticolia bacterium]
MHDHRPAPLGLPAGASGPWSLTLAFSLLLHLAGFGIALGLPYLLPRLPSSPPVYVVDLVAVSVGPTQPAAPAAAPPAPAARAPEKKAAPPVKIPGRNAKKVEPKKPEPKKKVEPPKPEASATATPSPSTTAAAPGSASKGTVAAGAAGSGSAPGAPGGPGGTGAGQADAYSFYASLLKRNIEAAWKRPLLAALGLAPGARPPTVLVRVTLTNSGRVTGVDVVSPSGYEAMDRSVLEAIQDAQPFPPFPSQLGVEARTFTFEVVLEQKTAGPGPGGA